MPAAHVLIEPHDGVVVLRLERPQANAFCLELARDCLAAFGSDAVKRSSALVVTGTGSFFSGGLDLHRVPSYMREQQHEFLAVLNRVIGTASMPAEGYRRIKQQLRGATLARIEAVVASGADPLLAHRVDPRAPQASAEWLARSKRPARTSWRAAEDGGEGALPGREVRPAGVVEERVEAPGVRDEGGGSAAARSPISRLYRRRPR